MTTTDQSSDLTLHHYSRPIRNRVVLIVVCVLLGAGLGMAAAIWVPTEYTAKAAVLVSPISTDPSEGLGTQVAIVDMATEAELATSLTVTQRVNDALDGEAPAGSEAELRSGITAEVVEDSRVLLLRYTHPDPDAARRGSEAYAEQYVLYRSQLADLQITKIRENLTGRIEELRFILAGVAEDLTILEADGLEGTAQYAAREIEQQALLGELNVNQRVLAELTTTVTDNASIIDEARTPTTPSSLGTVPLLISGAVLGLIVGVALAFAAEALADRRRAVDRGRSATEVDAAETLETLPPPPPSADDLSMAATGGRERPGTTGDVPKPEGGETPTDAPQPAATPEPPMQVPEPVAAFEPPMQVPEPVAAFEPPMEVPEPVAAFEPPMEVPEPVAAFEPPMEVPEPVAAFEPPMEVPEWVNQEPAPPSSPATDDTPDDTMWTAEPVEPVRSSVDAGSAGADRTAAPAWAADTAQPVVPNGNGHAPPTDTWTEPGPWGMADTGSPKRNGTPPPPDPWGTEPAPPEPWVVQDADPVPDPWGTADTRQPATDSWGAHEAEPDPSGGDLDPIDPWGIEPAAIPAAEPDAPSEQDPAAGAGPADVATFAAAQRAIEPILSWVITRLDQGGRTALVVDGGDGSSAAVAFMLARELASDRRRTLVMDVNLDHPTLHSLLGVPLAPGLAQALDGSVAPSQLIRPLPDMPTLEVCSAGTGQLDQLFHPLASELLDALRTQYDAVVLVGGSIPGSPMLQGFVSPPDAVIVTTTGSPAPAALPDAALREVQASCRPLIGIVSTGSSDALTPTS